MYEPDIKITETIQNGLETIERIRSLLRKIPVIPIAEEYIRNEALVETVHYTARIEGNPLSKEAVERIHNQELTRVHEGRSEQEVRNLFVVMEFIREIADQTDIPIDEDVIKQIHAYVVRDLPEQGPPGVYKTAQNYIIDRATEKQIFLPPNPYETIEFMKEFSSWLSRSGLLALHPIIAAGIAHLELAAIHPFMDGNGRTARALADLVLYRHGFKLRYLFSWVRQVGIEMSTYHQKLRDVLGDKYGANIDPTIWLEYFVDSVARSLTEKEPMLISLRDSFLEFYNIGAEIGLSSDQVEALSFAVIYGSVSTGIYMDAKKLSRSTVVKRLNDLVEKGFLRVIGKGRSLRYVPVPSEEILNSEQKKRGVQLGLEMPE